MLMRATFMPPSTSARTRSGEEVADTTTSGAASATHVDDPDFAARIKSRDAQALEEVVRKILETARTNNDGSRDPSLILRAENDRSATDGGASFPVS